MLALSEEERRAFINEFLEELEEEHSRREAVAREQHQQRRSNRQEKLRKEREMTELRNELRRKFYEDRGYKQAVDTTGREVWLSPSEFNVREKKHKRRRKRRFTQYSPKAQLRIREILFFVAICIAAIVIGLLLAR